MSASWKKDSDPKLDHQLILKELVKYVHHDSNGVFYTLGAEQYTNHLSRLISFNKAVPESAHYQLVSEAIGAVRKKGAITDSDLIKEVSKQTAAWLRKPLSSYLIATSISIRYSPFWYEKFARSRRIDGLVFKLNKTLHDKLDWESVRAEAKRFDLPREPSDYTFVSVRVNARSEQEALDNAFESLDLLRGIWNFSLNRGQKEFRFGGGPQPYNKIIRGPFSKLYSGKGPKPSGGLWSSDSFNLPGRPSVDLSRAWESLMESETRIRKRLRRHPFRAKVEGWIRSYGRSLDLQNYNSAYLSLWRIIEQMSGIGPNENHTEIARRVSFLFEDTEYHRLVLHLLRELRNEAVHIGKEISRASDTLDELRMYAEILLSFHINNPFGFSQVSGAAEFLRLSPDLKRLEIELKLRRDALTYRRGRPKSSPETKR